MTQTILTRRTVLASTTLLAAGFSLAARPSVGQQASTADEEPLVAYKPNESGFPYEITRTEAEWQEYLDHDELTYGVLRLAKTEAPKSTDLWLEPHDAGYLCRGCDLPLYEARWFQRLDKGWVFFHHAVPQSIMFGLDGPVPQYGQAGMNLEQENVISEVHCRRCGSHVGHHLRVEGMFLHCINGSALKLV